MPNLPPTHKRRSAAGLIDKILALLDLFIHLTNPKNTKNLLKYHLRKPHVSSISNDFKQTLNLHLDAILVLKPKPKKLPHLKKKA